MNDPLGLFEEDNNNDPLGLFSEEPRKEAGLGTAIKSSFANVGNMADLAVSTLAGSAAALFGDEQEALDIARNMEYRRQQRNLWANPENLELTTGGKVAGAIATLPLQVAAMGLSPAETTRTALESGESDKKAIQAGLVDAAGNIVGIALPAAKAGGILTRAGTGAAINIGQEYAARKAIQSVLETEQGKAAFEPTASDLAVSGIVGGGFGAALGPRGVTKAPTSKVGSIKEAQAARDITPRTIDEAPLSPMESMARQLGAEERVAQPEGVRTPIRDVADELLGLDERAARLRPEEPAPINETSQLELFDQPEQGRVPMQYEATPGVWRIDENGMPVRVDLSLEAQNLQNPLQRNLWGDELDVQVPRDPNATLPMDRNVMGIPPTAEGVTFRGDIENQRPLTEAIDDMGWAQRRGAIRKTKLGREMRASGELEAARVASETLSWLEANRKQPSLQKKGFVKKQGGGLLVDPFGRVKERNKLQDLLQDVPYRFQGLESLPNKERITYEQVKQLMGRQELSAAEKKVISDAYAVALHTSDADFVPARDFVQSLEEVISDYKFYAENNKRYADYGLENIGRGFDLEKLSEEDYALWERAFDTGDGATAARIMEKYGENRSATTRVLNSTGDFSQDLRNHFDDPNYVGHTRSFMEDGKRHVVEIQSDLLQKKDIPDQAKPLQKNWHVRLIREELADAAKKGETTVRFATADTVAKVEGWEDAIMQLRQQLEMKKKQAQDIEKQRDSGQQFYDWSLLGQLNRSIENLKAEIERKSSAGERFAPEHQGIYDRYNKDVVKYLQSIGGKPVTDKFGETWIEVPVDPSRRRPIMFGQRGVLKIDWSDLNDADNALIRAADGSFIPDNPNAASTLQNAKQFIKDKIAKGQSPDINVIQSLQSGSTSVAMKTGNPIVKAVSEIVQNAGKRADLAIRNAVFPAEQALRKLAKQELIDLSDLMKDEMFNNRRFDADILANNLSEKQLRAYVQMRDLFDKTLDAQNAARRALGKPEISSKEAYLSSRWQGDFRQPVYDAKGNLVWYLAADSKMGLNAQIKALQKQFPDLVVDPKKARVVKSGKAGQDLQSMYSTVLDVLGRDDPAVQRIKEFVEAQTAIEGEAALGQSKHFKQKSNIRGFVGDRPGQTGIKESTAMMQQQIQYAKNAFQWSEMQKAAGDIKGLLADPEIQDGMPNAVKYSRDYFKNALGFGEGRLAKAFDDALRDSGVSPATLRSAVGNLKSFFILQKLAVSAGYVAANMVQSLNTLPYLANLRSQGFKGNPLTALSVGLFGTLPMAMSHYMKSFGIDYVDALPTQFLKDAIRYAEDNGVTARSIYDEAPVAESFSPVGTAARYAGKTMTIPETLVRSFAFMTYAQMLKDSGKFTDQMKLFQKAEELVNKSMVDYRETERPLIFGKAGTAGNMLNTLQTYPISFYNQFAYMAGEAAKGRPAGFMAMLMFQAAAAGALGLPYMQDIEKLFAWLRDNATDDETYTSMMESEFFSDPRLWLIEKGNALGNVITQELADAGLNVDFTRLGESAVYGPLSTNTGVSMTARVAAPAPTEMLQSPVGPIADIGKQVMSAGKAVLSPSETNLAQAAMNSVPIGLQGLLETAPFMEGITYDTRQDGTRVYRKTSDLADQQAMYQRTPAEDTVRKFGVRRQSEAMTRDVAYRTKAMGQEVRKRAQSLPDKILNAAKAGDVAKTEELVSVYARLTGRSISGTQLQNQIKEAYMTEVERLMTKKTLSPMEAMRVAKLKKIVETNQ